MWSSKQGKGSSASGQGPRKWAFARLPNDRQERDQSGVALITVIVVLGSMALLLTGVYSLVFEGGKSGRGQVRYELTRDFGEGGIDQMDALIKWISRAGSGASAPSGMGYSNGWDRDSFAAYLRGEADRSNFSGVGSCSQTTPDIEYTTHNGEVRIAICVVEATSGSMAGQGTGVVHGRVSGGGKASESEVFLAIWAEGPEESIAQFRALGRTIY